LVVLHPDRNPRPHRLRHNSCLLIFLTRKVNGLSTLSYMISIGRLAESSLHMFEPMQLRLW
jgi:hypothetical protein